MKKSKLHVTVNYVLLKYLEFNASERTTVNEVMENLNEDLDVAITNLAVSQATALEFNDRKIVEANIDPEILQVTSIPDNNGTNLCAFLSLGIVNQLTKNKSCRNNGRLGKINAKKKKKKKNACSIFHTGIYIFAIYTDYDQNIRVFDSHPTPTELGRNGTGVVVHTKNPHFIYKWIIKRLRCSKCSACLTPFVTFGMQKKVKRDKF